MCFISTARWKRLPACLPASVCVSAWVCVCAGVYVSGRVNMFVGAHVYIPWSVSVCPTRRSVEMQGARSSVARLLVLSCCVCAVAAYPFRTPLDLDVTPRITVLRSGKHGNKHTQGFALKSVFLNSLWCIPFMWNCQKSKSFEPQTLNTLRRLITQLLMQGFPFRLAAVL